MVVGYAPEPNVSRVVDSSELGAGRTTWHCQIAALGSQILKIFFAPAARRVHYCWSITQWIPLVLTDVLFSISELL